MKVNDMLNLPTQQHPVVHDWGEDWNTLVNVSENRGLTAPIQNKYKNASR